MSVEKANFTHADKLFNRFNATCQDWGAATEDEGMSPRKLTRIRSAYYKARHELVEYLQSLERTNLELAAKIDGLYDAVAEKDATIRQLDIEVGDLGHQLDIQKANVSSLSAEIEKRNKAGACGESEITRDYLRKIMHDPKTLAIFGVRSLTENKPLVSRNEGDSVSIETLGDPRTGKTVLPELEGIDRGG